jgi:hypothetical protein
VSGSAPITQTAYVNSQASVYYLRIFLNASSAGASALPSITPDPDALRSNRQQWVDYYESYVQSFSGNPIGGPSDLGH